MVISSVIKIMRSIGNSKTTFNNLRVFFESDDIKENIISLEPSDTISVNTEQGLCIVSDGVFSVSGDITLLENSKILFIGSALDIVITNPSTTDDLSLKIYTW